MHPTDSRVAWAAAEFEEVSQVVAIGHDVNLKFCDRGKEMQRIVYSVDKHFGERGKAAKYGLKNRINTGIRPLPRSLPDKVYHSHHYIAASTKDYLAQIEFGGADSEGVKQRLHGAKWRHPAAVFIGE